MARLRNAAGVVGWFVLLGLLLGALLKLEALFPIPAVTGISAWLIDTPTAEIALTVVRALCLVGVGYLLVASLVAVVLEVARIELRIKALDAIPVRRLMRNALGVSLAASTLAPMSPADAAVDSRNYPILHHVDPNAATTTTRPVTTSTTTTTTAPITTPSLAPSIAPIQPTEPEATEPVPDLRTHTVASGDSLWSIAEGALSSKEVPATNAEIAELVTRIGDANKAIFVDPNNRDLIFPGQVFRLPAV